jgi:hypothetical protein
MGMCFSAHFHLSCLPSFLSACNPEPFDFPNEICPRSLFYSPCGRGRPSMYTTSQSFRSNSNSLDLQIRKAAFGGITSLKSIERSSGGTWVIARCRWKLKQLPEHVVESSVPGLLRIPLFEFHRLKVTKNCHSMVLEEEQGHMTVEEATSLEENTGWWARLVPCLFRQLRRLGLYPPHQPI